jgi:gluconate kinase
MTKNFYLFLDECGDQNLANFDITFPVFTLCGILVSENGYDVIKEKVAELKRRYWNGRKVILHSRDIRKCEKGFEILFNPDIKKSFYENINEIMRQSEYSVISCSILKEPYIRKYGKLGDVYGLSLSYIIERTVFALDSKSVNEIAVHLIAEKRGKKEDNALLNYYNKVLDRGTYFIKSQRIKSYFKSFEFKSKSDDIIGLQIADLAAYPITRHLLDCDAVNFAYDVIEPKIFEQNGKKHGLKIFP